MADFSLPTVSSNYVDFVDELKERDVAALVMLEGISATNLPANAKRWNTGGWLESWNGSAWSPLTIAATGLAADAVETAKIKDAAVTTAKLNNGAVTEGKIGSGAVTTAKIGDSQVTNAKIAGNAVSSAKLATAVQDDIASRALASRTITGGTGLLNGGDLTANRTIDADIASTGELRSGAANKLAAGAQLREVMEPQAIASGSGNLTINLNNGLNAVVGNFTGNRTLLAFTNARAGDSGVIRFGTVGSYTLAFNTAWKLEGGDIEMEDGGKLVYDVEAVNGSGTVTAGTLYYLEPGE